jgi:hypothetical protein
MRFRIKPSDFEREFFLERLPVARIFRSATDPAGNCCQNSEIAHASRADALSVNVNFECDHLRLPNV